MSARVTNCTCGWCKKQFQARTADVNRGWGKFCSKACKAKEQEKRTGQNRAYRAGQPPSGMQEWERREIEHNQVMYETFASHGQDGL